MIRISLPLLRWLALWLALTAPLGALEIRQTIWGFDGRLVPCQFNPVSVLVDNPRPGTFDGQIVLQQTDGGLRGTEHVQPIYLAPQTARWVQFHIFVGNYAGRYALQWGRGPKDRYEILEEIKLGPPACVWLRDAASPFASAGALKSFPDELFPTTVAATETLSALVLDHVPRWEPARREAFLDWLKLGGTVHLLPGADGRYAVFADGLEALNATDGESRLGSGRIVRHQIGTREMSVQYLTDRGYAPPTLQKAQGPVIHDLESLFSQRLSSLTRPTVSWTLIHLLALAYIGVIGPLHYRYRRKLDYRVSILVFLATVAVFGMLFAVVGRRGYGESQTVNSLTIARSLGGGRYDAMQWINAFATTGDLYTLTHGAPTNLYGSIAADAGASRILNGKDGRIHLDIPLYSSRTFLHRAVMTGIDATVTVEPGADRTPGTLRLRTGPGFPKDFVDAKLYADGNYHDLTLRDGVLQLTDKSPKTISQSYWKETLGPLAYHYNRFSQDRDPDSHRQLAPLLAARALGVKEIFPQTVVPPANLTQPWKLCIVAPAPESFRLRGPGFERERGWVLYVQDIVQP